jgi:hypothetical protein
MMEREAAFSRLSRVWDSAYIKRLEAACDDRV